MNSKSREILIKEGWYEGRNIDISFWEEKSKKQDFEFFEEAKKFIREFGGICIHTYDPVTKGPFPSQCFDDTLFFADDISQTIKEKAICVGTIYENNFNLYISESGKVYYDYGFMGNNIYEAWDCILETMPRKEIFEIRKSWKELGIEEDYREATYEYLYPIQSRARILGELNKGLTLDEIAEKCEIRVPFIVKMLNKKLD